MAFCKSCGSEIGDAKFCPACGIPQESAPAAQVQDSVYEPIVAAPITAPVFTAAPSDFSSAGDTSGSGPSQIPVYTAPVYSPDSFDKPNTSGQTVFSIINIVVGFLLCCCSGVSFISMVLGIIALVFTSQAGKAPTADEAQRKLKSAKIMNIIAVVILGVSLLVFILLLISGTLASTLADYGYDYSF